jgi:hypothetical protein
MVQGCTRTKQTFWTEDQFTFTVSSGIRDRNVRVAEIVVRELEKDKPDKLGCVQTRDLWSPEEERQVCPGLREPDEILEDGLSMFLSVTPLRNVSIKVPLVIVIISGVKAP